MSFMMKSCFHDVNIPLFVLHPLCMRSVRKRGDGEVNPEHKAQIVPSRCLSLITMSHSFAPQWALINSNFTF